MTTRKHIAFVEDSPIYSPSDIETVLKEAVNKTMTVGNNKGIYYYNIPCSFDIETSSFYIDENGKQIDYVEKQKRMKSNPVYNPEKRAIMYVWQFGINGRVIIGRTWQEFVDMVGTISHILQLNEKLRLMVFVHNLAYEFQFMCKWFEWEKVFSIDLRKPIYAITSKWIEFRCSYLLSGYSLKFLGTQLLKYKVEKKTGDLDYSLIRHSETPLTEKEIGYCVNDVRVVMAYIQEKIENEGDITQLPITKTGYVRQYCKKECLYLKKGHKRNMKYFKQIHGLTINTMNEFDLLQRAFQGGFTHANAYYSGEVLEDVASYDFTSSYPAVMIMEKFPMSRGTVIEIKSKQQFLQFIDDKRYVCVFDITFENLMTSQVNENYISVSKCRKTVDVVENNGRVVAAKYLETTITNVDYNIIRTFYTWTNLIIENFHVYTADYLPTPLVNAILELYEKKTTLKGVKGKELEYLKSKEMINSVYGMSVTNPLRDEYIFDGGEWGVYTGNDAELLSMLYKYNDSNNRFLFYAWGIFVTAYARRNLFTAIYELGDDYIYSDTDSVKILNHDKHKNYFEWYNNTVDFNLRNACIYHGLDFEKVQPKTIKGAVKKLGVWDFEGVYTRFKTLGAKRYMVEHEKALTIDGVDYPISITVSGVNKNFAVPYLMEMSGGDTLKAFEMFQDGLFIPPEKTGKNLHSYADYEISGIVVDYTGKRAAYHEKSYVHLEPTSYDLSLSRLYTDYLKGISTITE